MKPKAFLCNALMIALVAGSYAGADAKDGGSGPPSLRTVAIPAVPNLGDFVANRDAAILLGKSLFWDQQVGSDGRTACATCHFQAGSDTRSLNGLNPGPNGGFDGGLGADVQLAAADFPFHKLANPADNRSAVLADTDDIGGSQGVLKHSFNAIVPGSPFDNGTLLADPIFQHNGNVRQVTGRNAPSVVNAVFNLEQFWDGRAKNTFNGVNIKGDTDPAARVLSADGTGALSKVRVSLRNSALASQSVGPPLSGVEMSFAGRTWPDLGKKMLTLRPLAGQDVNVDDSVLKTRRHGSGLGLDATYAGLIQDAFRAQWWNSNRVVDASGNVVGTGTPGPGQFSQMESNFALFWGLALQAYESTLVADDSPYDRFAAGQAGALTARQRRGLDLFVGQARCASCHSGAEFTGATVAQRSSRAFTNTGVRAVAEDGGRGLGKFKTPTVRNAELNAPYFHNGNQASLRQVVEFYNRGGDFPNQNTDSQVRALGLSDADMDALVDFMLALTDNRVRTAKAPFDHPELDVPNGPHLLSVGAAGAGPVLTFAAISPFAKSGAAKVSEGGADLVPDAVVALPSLRGNYPNPFNPSTKIAYSLPAAGHVRLSVYDVAGQKVRTLVDAEEAAGSKTVEWNGRTDGDVTVATGVYFVRLEAGGTAQTKKVQMVK